MRWKGAILVGIIAVITWQTVATQNDHLKHKLVSHKLVWEHNLIISFIFIIITKCLFDKKFYNINDNMMEAKYVESKECVVPASDSFIVEIPDSLEQQGKDSNTYRKREQHPASKSLQTGITLLRIGGMYIPGNQNTGSLATRSWI